MTPVSRHITAIRRTLPEHVTLVCVSKFQPIEAIQQAYDCGERDFAESRVQELLRKYDALPKDIRWHFIGHLQTNKVRAILPFVHLIQSVDSTHLLDTINSEAGRIGRRINVLLEVHLARETTKSGFLPDELPQDFTPWPQVNVCGLMTMATNTDDEVETRRCFRLLRQYAARYDGLHILSMGMTDDYPLAIEEGANLIRIGTGIFGLRN
ncbi:MAG: YggS family pyridoxal phosphate-dependent enzyme [Paludibacteraceae bacterium]|nr:YggS family pyridoxal phosphate-dependent enzyme [Paludibacteraceae bacterium]